MRHCGVNGVIAACAVALALAGSPQGHESIHRGAAWPSHSCAITLLEAGKCIKAIESHTRPLVRRTPAVVAPGQLPKLSPIWVPKLFLEACRCEHGPPALS
ncbi:MAG: hypothetical protein DMF30_00405 [Verrucomicrobia bacterium]|nr:MAG: hypothetical protein DMF30_00405 [Verrucomicrobiota bacterium]